MANSRNGNSGSIRDVEATSVHLSLQGKGGAGKSLAASLLAQYFKHRKGIGVRCIDADPVNQTLAQYKGLGAERLDLMREGSVDQRAFDGRDSDLPIFLYGNNLNSPGFDETASQEIFHAAVQIGDAESIEPRPLSQTCVMLSFAE